MSIELGELQASPTDDGAGELYEDKTSEREIVNKEEYEEFKRWQRAKEKLEEEVNMFPPLMSRPQKAMNFIIVAGLMGFMMYLIWLLYQQYHLDHTNPPTIVTYEQDPKGLTYPAITVCNWATGVPLDMGFCVVYSTPPGSQSATQTQDCSATSLHRQFYPPSSPDDSYQPLSNLYYDCWTINPGNTGYIALSNKMAFYNAIYVSFVLNVGQYPDSSLVSAFAVFHDPDSTPSFVDLDSASDIAGASVLTLFSITKVKTIYINGTSNVTWDIGSSSLSLRTKNGTTATELDSAELMISYVALATQIAQQQYAYDSTKLMADIVAYFGTLLDWNLYKIVMVGQAWSMLAWYWKKIRDYSQKRR